MAELVAAQTPPTLKGPSDKEKKYDRQLRLWAANGQAALESANVLLFNTGSGTVGVETLKNLVLPGIGKFTIVDDATVTEADLGVNFFVDEASLGESRAQSCTDLLLELNPEVQGDWFPKNEETLDLAKILADAPTFSIILYTFPIQPEQLQILQDYGRKHLTPLFAVHSAGLYSYFRISLPDSFPIVDTHPDATATTDLRLSSPWPELQNFAKEMTKDIDSMDDHAHGHLPYLVILLHFLEKWKEIHGDYPKNYSDKAKFRIMVAEGARPGGEENFDEAVAAVVKTVVSPTMPPGLKEIFEYSHTEPIEQKASFWVIADAIKAFHQKHGCLPLPGSVPDMKAESTVYIQLQNLYKSKARQDVEEVLQLIRQAPGGKDVDPEEVKLFCKNAAFVKLINAGPTGSDRLAEITKEQLANDEIAKTAMMPLSLIPIYLALLMTSHNPHASSEEILKGVGNIAPGAEQNERIVKVSKEVARSAGGELHNTSALTGGMVAQEMIKIITKQYVPVDNTCIFDGIGSRAQVLRL